MGASFQRHTFGGFSPLRPVGRVYSGMTEPDKCSTAEVNNQKRDVESSQRLFEPLAEHVGRSDWRRVLDGFQEFRQIQSERSALRHSSEATHARGRRPCSSQIRPFPSRRKTPPICNEHLASLGLGAWCRRPQRGPDLTNLQFAS